jgi:hypothetical protein
VTRRITPGLSHVAGSLTAFEHSLKVNLNDKARAKANASDKRKPLVLDLGAFVLMHTQRDKSARKPNCGPRRPLLLMNFIELLLQGANTRAGRRRRRRAVRRVSQQL